VTDIEKADPILNFNIIKDGKVLFSRDEDLRKMDRFYAMSLYYDRQYYYERNFRIKLKYLAKK